MRVSVPSGAAALGSILLLCLLASCPKPGEGGQATRCYRRAEPLIAALTAYRAQHARYPDTLATLVPEFLSAEDLPAAGQPLDGCTFDYQRTDDGYQLRFRYTGPGMNVCTYTPATGRWSCYGYF